MTPRDGILILDAERAVIEEANPFITELLGYSREELLGRSFRDLGFLGDRAKGTALFEEARRDGYVRCDRLPLRIRDDGSVFVELVGHSYIVDDRKVIQFNVHGASLKSREEEALLPESAEVDPLRVLRLGHAVQLEARSLLLAITDHARLLTRADSAELWLRDPERDVLERAQSSGAGVPAGGGAVLRGEGLAGRVWETGQAVHIDGAGPADRCALGAPIRWRDEFLGVLGSHAGPGACFSTSEAGLLDLLAGQAAVTIVNSRLSAEIERLAVVDELTGVFNRRGLVILGAREIERARRLGRPLAALFADLDHFKSLNDDYSHEVGDQALREISRRIHGSMRRIDTVARYGGEEFVILLAETELDPAVEVAERVRQIVEATKLATGRGTTHLTVSVGVAAHGPETLDLEALIRRADEAMYAAKQAGRNRVVALAS
jgi:diguanylate cyclase (GGDEF)-like protein/PAS domain S-box-containing protein